MSSTALFDADNGEHNEPREPPLDDLIEELVTANHILHYHGVVDAYGHISVRHPKDARLFLLSSDLAPALVASRRDIEVYRVQDASPVGSDAHKGYAERFIHSEIYKRYSDVNAVIHSHNDAVLPFSISSLPLRPVYHMAGVMGAQVPVFDITRHYRPSDTSHSLLVNNEHLGSALAAGFSPPSLTSKVYNYLTSSTPDPITWPTHTTVLMRGHGFSCVGQSIEEAVFRAIFTCNNARIQTTALTIQATHNLGSLANRIGSGDKNAAAFEVDRMTFLSDRECKDSWNTMQGSIARPWKLWCAEVANSSLYKNEISLSKVDKA